MRSRDELGSSAATPLALEARLRGMQTEMTNYTDEQCPLRDALWYCDLTTSPDGRPVSALERIAEIKERYGPGDLVTRFITDASCELLAAVQRTEALWLDSRGLAKIGLVRLR